MKFWILKLLLEITPIKGAQKGRISTQCLCEGLVGLNEYTHSRIISLLSRYDWLTVSMSWIWKKIYNIN